MKMPLGGMIETMTAEAATTAVMQRQDIPVRVDIGLGQGKATVWTCDLTKEYVAINGDYRS